MTKIKNSALDQYGAEPVEQQQFGTAGIEGDKLDSQTCSVYHKEFQCYISNQHLPDFILMKDCSPLQRTRTQTLPFKETPKCRQQQSAV